MRSMLLVKRRLRLVMRVLRSVKRRQCLVGRSILLVKRSLRLVMRDLRSVKRNLKVC